MPELYTPGGRKHIPQKRDNRREDGSGRTLNINVNGNVQPGTHIPQVLFSMGEQNISLPISDALSLASVLTQAASMAYQDSLLLRFWETSGMDPLVALQTLAMFQQFRLADIQMQQALASSVQGGPPAESGL